MLIISVFSNKYIIVASLSVDIIYNKKLCDFNLIGHLHTGYSSFTVLISMNLRQHMRKSKQFGINTTMEFSVFYFLQKYFTSGIIIVGLG